MTIPSTPDIPIVCDMTDATDTLAERLAEYQQVFGSLVDREATETGIRFRLRGDDRLLDQVTDLSVHEHACCPFMFFNVTRDGSDVVWDVSVTDDDTARAILGEYYKLPESLAGGTDALFAQFAEHGLEVVINDGDSTRPASLAEIGVSD